MAEFKEVCKEMQRLCDAQESCEDCVLHNGKCPAITFKFKQFDCAAAECLVKLWAREHPMKTWLGKLKEILPKADIDVTQNCPRDLFGGDAPQSSDKYCDGNCVDCWNREATDSGARGV